MVIGTCKDIVGIPIDNETIPGILARTGISEFQVSQVAMVDISIRR